MMHFDNWRRLWCALGASSDGAAIHADLLKRYDEPHRGYHTQQHIQECLEIFKEVRSEALKPDHIEAALWFHDVIYDTHLHDNEAQSATFAVAALSQSNINKSTQQNISHLILATSHHPLPQDPDARLLVDIDLSILGRPRSRFEEYETQVRAEYAWVPEAMFLQVRAGILAKFWARETLFFTPYFQTHYEAQARENLSRSLTKLGHPPQ